jgi:hypothetical protein
MPDVVLNEQTKLLANALDRASTMCLTVGVFGPLAAAYYSAYGLSAEVWIYVIGAASWGLAALFLHLEGQRILRSLQP